MTYVGRIIELWRYPVSSIGGEAMDTISIARQGVVGDRQFVLYECETGLPAAPDKEARWRPALLLKCDRRRTGLPCVGFPDGASLKLDDEILPARLTEFFGFPVAVGMYPRSDNASEFRFPVIENRYAPSALHLLTTASLQTLAHLGGFTETDSRRFRPSILIGTEEADGFVENAWIGRGLQIGNVRVDVTEGTKRCGMTLIAQPGIADKPEILRTIVRSNARNLGVYAAIATEGAVSVGDKIYADN